MYSLPYKLYTLFFSYSWCRNDLFIEFYYKKSLDINISDINTMPNYCGICIGHHLLTFTHISSHIHRSNINKLPFDWWKIADKDLKKTIHNPEKLKQYEEAYFASIGL